MQFLHAALSILGYSRFDLFPCLHAGSRLLISQKRHQGKNAATGYHYTASPRLLIIADHWHLNFSSFFSLFGTSNCIFHFPNLTPTKNVRKSVGFIGRRSFCSRQFPLSRFSKKLHLFTRRTTPTK